MNRALVETATKRCSACGETRPRSEFWNQAKSSSDGLCVRCKPCMRADCRKRYLKHGKTTRYKEQQRIRSRRYLEAHPEVRAAHIAANNHKATLKKSECERCGVSGGRLHMHHPDYNKPLGVVTLCVPCHNAAHHGELK